MNEAKSDESEFSALLCFEYGMEIASLMFEDWMDNEDKEAFIRLFVEKTGVTMEKLNESIKIGISNGYSVEDQLTICKKIMEV